MKAHVYRVLFWLAALFAMLPACSAALPASRALCYFQADQHAQARVDAECRIGDAGVAFAECPAHDDIMAEMARNQAECK